MKIVKKIFIALLILFIAIQFFRPARNISTQNFPRGINHTIITPDPVLTVLKNSCYDCHSNNTRYPWYNNIQPVAWWLHSHISDGKRALNFDEFGSYTLKRQQDKLKGIRNEVKDGGMPLSSYTLIHTDAKLSDAEKKMIADWTVRGADSLEISKGR